MKSRYNVVIICLATDQAYCCVTESGFVGSFNLGGMFTEGGAFLAKVVKEQLQPSTTHPGEIKLYGLWQYIPHLVCSNKSSQKNGDGIFDEEPVVVANCYRGEVDRILVAKTLDQK